MKNTIIISFLVLGLISTGCHHRISRNYSVKPDQPQNCDITIKKYLTDTTLLKKIGDIRLGDTGFSMWCNEAQAIEILKKDGCAINADIINIIEETRPDFMSTCYRCRAEFYKFKPGATQKDLDSVLTQKANQSLTSGVKKKLKDYPRLRVGLFGGWSYLIGKTPSNIPPEFKQYFNNLKSGGHYGGNVEYYFNEIYGIGLTYNVFKTSNEFKNIYVTYANGTTKYGNMSDEITTSFFGPTFNTRILGKTNLNCFSTAIGLGYMTHLNNNVIVDKYIITGNTLGLLYSMGYDYGMSDEIAIGVHFTYLTGTLINLNINDGNVTKKFKLKPGEFQSLNHFDISVGIRYIFPYKKLNKGLK